MKIKNFEQFVNESRSYPVHGKYYTSISFDVFESSLSKEEYSKFFGSIGKEGFDLDVKGIFSGYMTSSSGYFNQNTGDAEPPWSEVDNVSLDEVEYDDWFNQLLDRCEDKELCNKVESVIEDYLSQQEDDIDWEEVYDY